MYETADMNSPGRRHLIEMMRQEARAEVPEWTRDRISANSQRTAQPAASTKPKAPVKAPTRAKKDDSVSKRFMATANKCDEGTRQFKDKIAQIDRDIIALSMYGMKSENYDAIVALKQEKEDLQSRCAKLQQIKTRCLKEAV